MFKKNLKLIVVTLVILATTGIGVGAYFIGQNQDLREQISKTLANLQPSQSLDLSNAGPDSSAPKMETSLNIEKVSVKPVFSGKIRKLGQDLGLISKEFNPVYYSAGKVLDGKYKDYERILMKYEYGAGGSDEARTNYTFLTKDNQKFVLINAVSRKIYPEIVFAKTIEEASEDNTIFNEDSTKSVESWFDLNKVSNIDVLEDEFPEQIKLDQNFSLVKNSLFPTNYTEDLNGEFKDLGAIVDFGKYSKLRIPNINFNIYIKSYQVSDQEVDKYISQNERFLVSDSTDLTSNYVLATNKSIERLPEQLKEYTKALKIYEDHDKQYTQTEQRLSAQGISPEKMFDEIIKVVGPRPEYPIYPFPSTDIKVTDLQNVTNKYDNYSAPFPNSCGISSYHTVAIQNVQGSELEKIGSSNSIDIFKIKDANHPLYKAQFEAKISFDQDPAIDSKDDLFVVSNPGVKKPTYEEYLAKNPLIFFKDPFDRLVALGEYDYLLPGGCGKPVIYLYPNQETKVNVKFLSQIQLTTDIPKYDPEKGWNVLAKPNGELKDLQPSLTNCDQIDSNKKSSEYAKEACETNNYPYIYWSGNSIGVNYPKQSKGWLVEKANLNQFLDQKLDKMGLNTKEKTDMMEYWLPYLQNKKGNYFRISFLQNQELDKLLPTKITPKPDQYFRIFLDWDSFEQKPSQEIEPQKLEILTNRNGFTAVEWGGLKKN